MRRQGSRSSASLASKRNFLIVVAILCLIQRFAVVNAQYNSEGCAEGEFDCGNHCIPNDRVCDKTEDCDDGLDEEHCPRDCSADEFECQDGTCIELDQKCDSREDCPNGEDEKGCEDEDLLDFRCTDDEFQCPDQCISKSSVCDSFVDCSDGSDEENCNVEPEGCSENQFRCSNGLCVEQDSRCNGYPDCIDGSDEKECDFCAEGNFHCRSGECIPSSKRCDNQQDCEDLSDEGDCEPVHPLECGPNQFQCDGLCFDDNQKCDGHADCTDGSDEANCPAPKIDEVYRCPELTCPDGTCYSYVEKCDNNYQCRDGTDELDCRCSPGEFQCANLQCVPESARCNQQPECRDQSDEWGCPPPPAPTAPPSCHPSEFQCRSGECIPRSKQCDNRPDCGDYSDEYGCAESRPQTNPESVPSFNLKTYPNDQIIKERQIREGREVVFQCRDEGPNRARVRWTRGPGRKLPTGSRDINGRLEIPNIRVSDSGIYYCEADGYPTTLKGAAVTVNLVVERFNRTEYQHPPGCGPQEATCMNGNCIPRSAICDGNYDCPDGSDEASCSKTSGCEPNEFKCRNNKCVLKTWRCDGQNDCIDNSDEENCATLGPDAPCRYDEFQCRSGQCIPKTYQCDQQSDCLDNSDEIGCSKPTVLTPPPARINLKVGSVFSITCRAIGFPVPIVTWRLNWNNVPEKCVQTSEDGLGTLTCADIQVRDSGAYSCEVINSVGSIIVSPDTILVVDGDDVCHSGSFNSKASRPEECISCFCFGVSNQCSSADLFIYSIPPQVQSLNVVGVDGPWAGVREITVSEFKEHDLIATRRGVQLRLSDIPLSQQLPYYALPENYQGNQLKSYGGWFKYNVQYTGHGAPNDAPDVILIGNQYTLSYRGNSRLESGREHRIAVQFAAGNWYKSDGQLATREELMMTLANTENLLIKLQYVDHVQREVELTNIEMDSAAVSDRGLGSAHLVEECRCPSGYTGLSCEQCAHGYVRQKSGAWLGRCVREELQTCRPGTYGDPSRGIPCTPCPCPLTTPSNNFAPTCRLGSDGDVICDCNRGYTGRRCETCDRGYVGNPLVPGDSCRPAPPPSRCNEVGTEYESNGQCRCKQNVVGSRCDQCAINTFHLNWNAAGGCTECFCMGITKECTSSKLFRQSIQTSLGGHYDEDLSIIYNFDNPEVAATRLSSSPQNREVVFRNPRTDDPEVYYWSLPTRFVGNKLTAYGGLLNYTLRFTPVASASMSRNNAPDVVIKSENDITILHYRRDEVNPRGSQTYSVPIVETQWQRQDGQVVNREHLLMTLAQVSYIFIKATYTTMTEEAALSHVSLDIAGERSTNYDAVRAVEVEQCSCPLGHTGLSCESCSPGYKRSNSGIYLNVCEKCECNGHSDECDPETGVCLNCRHDTTGDNCELCIRGGNATAGTPYDCESDSLTGCNQCDNAGTSSCDDRGCICKSNVEGSRCQNCRAGTFSLTHRNPLGCSECFCSGVSTVCQAGRFYREEIPMSVFAEDYAIVNRDNEGADHQIDFDFDTNRLIFNNDYDDNNYYWRLPANFLGKQLNSYGANLTYVLESIGSGDYTRGDDVIIRGNGQTLVWERRHDYFTGNEVVVPLVESEWKKADRSGSRHVTRFDLLSTLSNIDSILIRGSIHEENTQSQIGDIILGTAVPTVGGSSSTSDIEVCQCPSGYTGSSCESCDTLYYRDVDDRSKALAGACQRCPCSQNAESCELDSSRRVICNCKPSYYGDRCDETTPPTERPPLPPGEPQISVTISSNLLQIIEVGQTIRVNCTGRHIISNTPLATRWFKLHGRFSNRVYEDRGALIITNSQIDDSGIYVCQGKDGIDVVEEKISITIGDIPTRPVVRVNPQTVTTDEGAYVEVTCEASGIPQPDVYWERSDGYPLDHNIVRDQRDQRILRFPAIRKSEEGQYRCIARNSAGHGDDIVNVIVRAESPVTRPPSPTVHINPDYYSGVTGDEVRLSCVSNDVGATTIKWSKDRTVALPHYIIVNTDGLLIIRSASYEDSGRYICTVTTYTGVSMTSSVEVHINSDQGGGGISTDPPRINPLQTNHLVVQGTEFSLPCIATGSPQPRIKWTKLHETFDMNTRQVGNALVITNAQVSNRGVYICSAETDEGVSDQASTIIEIDQRQKPEIEIHPLEPQNIRIGGQAMLSCRSIAGIPDPTVVWERLDGRPISSRFQEQYKGTFILSNATMEDGGSYVCRGRNLVGEVTKTTTITIEEPPRLTLDPNTEQLEITEGDELVISCIGTGTPQPSVEWKQPQTVGTAAVFPHRAAPVPFAKVQIYRATHEDSGLYTCVGTSSAGTEHRYVQVIVKPKRGDVGPHDDDEVYRPRPPYVRPTANPYPEHDSHSARPYKVGLGDRATLDCKFVDTTGAIGRPTEWRRVDNRPLPSNSVNYDGLLVIENVDYDAQGQYECFVIDGGRPSAVGIADLIVVELPKITFSPEMPMTVRSGDHVRILCNVTGEQPIDVSWHMANRYQPLPRSVQVDGSYLIFNSITPSDQGRYSCTARNVHGNITKDAEVLVNNVREVIDRNPAYNKIEEVTEGDSVSLNCRAPVGHLSRGLSFSWHREGGEIPRNSYYDDNRLVLTNIRSYDEGRYVCRVSNAQGATSENYIDVRVKRHHLLPNLKLEPSRSFLQPGDSITVECTSSAGPHAEIFWEGIGGSSLPHNFRAEDNRLIINNADVSNTGRYTCKSYTEDNTLYSAEYELNVEDAPLNTEKRPPKVEHAEVRSTVVLRCNSHLYPATFHWSKEQGTISPDQDVTSSELRLIEVQASDAGTYVCRATHNGQSVDIPTILVVTGAIPYFPQAPVSYMSFPKMEDVFHKFNFEITFKPERPDGILLYNGQRRGSGDFIALSLNEGYVEFRMDLGKQPIIVKSKDPITMGEWHTVQVNRVRKDGYVIVDSEEPVPFPAHLRFQGLELEENLYLGGVAKLEDLAPHSSSPRSGYVGCVSRLVLGSRELSLKKDFLHQEGVTSCEPCADDPCSNKGVCLESQSLTGFSCVCAAGFTGSTCDVKGNSCSVGACGSGSCANTEKGMHCLCPVNRTGEHCELYEPLDPARLEFQPYSYAAYKAPRSGKFQLEFSFLPLTEEDGLLAYMAESEQGIGDFASVAIKDKHLEVRFNTMTNNLNPVIIRSENPIELNKWTEVNLGRRHAEGYLQVNKGAETKIRTAGMSKALTIKTPLYIGGRPHEIVPNRGVGISGDSFRGRIANLKISSQPIEMVASLKGMSNVRNFKEGNNIPENYEAIDETDCPLGYGGQFCDEIIDRCLAKTPCVNGGTCHLINGGDDTICDCPIGYSGESCELSSKIEYTVHMKGNGYIELDRSLLSNTSYQNSTEIAIMFSTLQPNGLLIWYGPETGEAFEGQDFMSVAVRNGHVELAYRLDGEETVITNEDIQVDDGGRHVLIMKRNFNEASLEVDTFTELGETRPRPRRISYLPGNIFIGGAPNLAVTTGGRMTQGFQGCVHIVEPTIGGPVDLGKSARSGVNVAACPSVDELEGTEPPVV